VAFSAIDASRQGFTTFMIEDASRAIDMAGSLEAAHEKMADAGVTIIQSSDL
jgi:nicotinamidase/pyrazinamidase